jgi:hypothetical protein
MKIIIDQCMEVYEFIGKISIVIGPERLGPAY